MNSDLDGGDPSADNVNSNGVEDSLGQELYRPCVGIVLANRQGRVFAGQRIDNPGGAWQMPQGGIDPGEAPAKAAVRELREETGIPQSKIERLAQIDDWLYYDLPSELVPKLWDGRYCGQKQKWFLFRFTGSDNDICIATEHPEFSEWRWLEPDELEVRIVPFKRQVYRQVIETFRSQI